MIYNVAMRNELKVRFPIWVVMIFIALIALPYIFAYQSSGPDHIFGGFILNPLDGNSYLAKMLQGWQGSWLSSLAYTPETGTGAFLFVYYLFLGHLARWIAMPLTWMFFFARLAGASFLAWALYHRIVRKFPHAGLRPWLFATMLLGSGAGWLLVLFGVVTADITVPEAYPFLSSFVNPHFPLGLALMVWLLTDEFSPRNGSRLLIHWFLGVLLAVMFPFGLVIVALVLGMVAVLEVLRSRSLLSLREPLIKLLLLGFGGGLILLYYIWVTQTDPLFAQWNAQNLTPSPPIWDLIVSLLPALIPAVFGISFVARGHNPQARSYAVWLVVSLVLMYLPFGLQRRMMGGLFIPVVWLAYYSLGELRPAIALRVGKILFFASVPTLLVLFTFAAAGILNKSPELYLARSEAEALSWISASASPAALVVASPQTGLFVPAYTGRRVYYGHPYESIQADARRQNLEDYFANLSSSSPWPLDADFLWIGPRERLLIHNNALLNFPIAFENNSVTIYSRP